MDSTSAEDMKKKSQTIQRKMMRMIIQTQSQAGLRCTAAQAASASVDVTADAEPHDRDSEQGGDTTEHNNQHLNEHEESIHDVDSNPCFDETSEDNPEDELEPLVDCINKKATHKADDL